MSQDINQRLIARISRRVGRSTWPRAVSMEPEVRTPIDIIPVTQRDDVERRELNPLPKLDPGAPSLGPYLFEWQYNVRVASIDAFRDWLKEFEDDLRRYCPGHFRYLGTFEALFGPSGQSPLGRYRTLWQHADLAGTLHLLRRKPPQKDQTREEEIEDDLSREEEIEEDLSREEEIEEDLFIKLLKELISFQDTSESSL